MTREEISQLRQRITQDFGPKCPEHNHFCACCAAHLAVDILDDLYDTGDLPNDHQQQGARARAKKVRTVKFDVVNVGRQKAAPQDDNYLVFAD